MEQWEYLPTYIEANAKRKEIRQFLKEQVGVKRPARYMVEALMPELDKLGADGWELVHMEPVPKVGGKGDVLFGVGYRWSNVYFCVFKRRRPGSVPEVRPVDSEGKPAFTPPKKEEDLMPLAPKPPEPLQVYPKSPEPENQIPHPQPTQQSS